MEVQHEMKYVFCHSCQDFMTRISFEVGKTVRIARLPQYTRPRRRPRGSAPRQLLEDALPTNRDSRLT